MNVLFRTFEPRDWDESKHPRDPAGTSTGGQFTGDGGGGEREPSGGKAPRLPGVKDVPAYKGRREGDTYKGAKVWDRRVDPSYFANHAKLKGHDEITTGLSKKTSALGTYYTREWATIKNGEPDRPIRVSEGGRVGVSEYGKLEKDPHQEIYNLAQHREGKPTGKHPGGEYSKHAVLRADGSIYTTDVHDAARALHEGKKVELDQPKKVSTLIHVLGKEAERMQKQGKDAPVFNLCDVSVSGTNLFCAESKGIPRIKMPQLDREQTKKFIEYLKDKGYGIERTRELAANLRATQDELNGAKVAANMDKIESGEGKEPRLVVSRDDYILDGHHRWAAKLGLDSKDGDLTNDTKMKISRVDISITKLLEEADKFTGGKGHVAVSAEGALLFREYSPSPFELRDFDESKHPRDERGRFSETGGEGEKEPPTAFVSPNVGNLTFDQAATRLQGEDQRRLATIGTYVDAKLGIAGTNRPVLGAWADGAENSMMIVAPGATSTQMRAASAMKGYVANQKSVLIFDPAKQDGHFLANLDVATDDLHALHDKLLEDGLPFHTLEPQGPRTRVHVFGSDQETINALDKVATDYGAAVRFTRGQGEFLGTSLEAGTDAEQRADARRVYEKTIGEISDSGALAGRNVGKIWNEVRDYWKSISQAKSLSRDFDESKHPRDEHGRWTDTGGGDEGEARREPKETEAEKVPRAEIARMREIINWHADNLGYPKEKIKIITGDPGGEDYSDRHGGNWSVMATAFAADGRIEVYAKSMAYMDEKSIAGTLAHEINHQQKNILQDRTVDELKAFGKESGTFNNLFTITSSDMTPAQRQKYPALAMQAKHNAPAAQRARRAGAKTVSKYTVESYKEGRQNGDPSLGTGVGGPQYEGQALMDSEGLAEVARLRYEHGGKIPGTVSRAWRDYYNDHQKEFMRVVGV